MNPYEQLPEQPELPSGSSAMASAQSAASPGKRRQDEHNNADDDEGIREQPGDDDPHDTGYDPLNPDAPYETP